MEEIAKVYARSLFAAAKEQAKLDTVKQQLEEVAAAFEDQDELSTFFFSPFFSTEEKREALGRVVVEGEVILNNFLQLLIDNGRLPLVGRIQRQFTQLWKEENRLLPVEVTSALPLKEEVVDRLGQQIGDRTGRKIELVTKVNPGIIGGVILRVGNLILDASISSRLAKLRKEVAKAA